LKVRHIAWYVNRGDLPLGVFCVSPAKIALQQKTAARRLIPFLQYNLVRGIVSDPARHPAEKFHVVFGQRSDAYETIGKLGEREAGLH
jgi:hypothetical protein